MIFLEKITEKDEKILHNLIQYYIYEFSKHIPQIKLEENGTYKPFNLNKYWNENNYHAFFIKFDNELIGFALVESETESRPNTIHEFFIVAKYNGEGYGKITATKIFNLFPGNWIVTQTEKNYRAQAFWRNLIYQLTDGNVVERYDEDRRSVQEFHTDSLIGGC
ncbi:GNAT family N-acetyltransferase [Ornithinibacillus salinisoli]|uniref:GNAT family N-acetyltransferase n=1 Tax=Ornithinibacillus salinisoli TaxID=1848459 RepID=A0ABW4VVH0_9BACI